MDIEETQPKEAVKTEAALESIHALGESPDDNYRTFYEVFVYSFCDSDGDGIGDFNGLTSKLDYLKDLGIQGIWLMTTFSVYNLARNNEFDFTKARTELGYTTRSYEETIHDEVQWMIAEGLIDGNGVTEKPTLMTNEQIREGGYMEDIIKAMEHVPELPEIDVEKAYEAIEENVVGTYKKIEDGVVSGYKKVEQGAVSGFRKVSDFFIKKLFSREGETVDETRNRLSRK